MTATELDTRVASSNELEILKIVRDNDRSGELYDTALGNVNDWKRFNDNQVVPLRIEQSIMYATLLNEQQDLNAKNINLTTNQTTQLNMVDRILSDFHNKGYGSMREFQSIDYKINLKNLYINIIKYTCLLASIVFLMIGLTMMSLFDQRITTIVASILGLIYFVIIFLHFKQNQVRRKYEWDKIYWKSPKDYKKEKTCKFLGIF
jgi:hypothetical protein